MTDVWEWCKTPNSLTLETVFRPQDQFCFLVGSGISLDPPSCLPTGHRFTRAVLGQLIPKEEQMNVWAMMDPERKATQGSGDFLRFEQLMEYLQRFYDPELHILDDYAKCRQPNFNHRFLAQMTKQGHPVLTTNFDSLIEDALLEINEPQTQICPVIYKEDWEAKETPKPSGVLKNPGLSRSA